MATHLGLTCVPKGAGSSFAGKTEADTPTGIDGAFTDGIGPTRIMAKPRYRAFYLLFVSLVPRLTEAAKW